MKKEFYALLGNNAKVDKREGDYDANNCVYYHKDNSGWTVTDSYSGRAVILGKKTKKEAQEAFKKMVDKLNEARKGEKYLQGVINYQELVDEVVNDKANELPF